LWERPPKLARYSGKTFNLGGQGWFYAVCNADGAIFVSRRGFASETAAAREGELRALDMERPEWVRRMRAGSVGGKPI
jgi:hypothetical protein